MILNHCQDPTYKWYNPFLTHNYLSFFSIYPFPMSFLSLSLFILISHYFLTLTLFPFSESHFKFILSNNVEDKGHWSFSHRIALYYLIFFGLNSQLQLWKVFFLFNFNWTERFVHFLLSLISILYCFYQISVIFIILYYYYSCNVLFFVLDTNI